jgi:hypothetical protein
LLPAAVAASAELAPLSVARKSEMAGGEGVTPYEDSRCCISRRARETPKWQAPGSRLFLGIDHSAIVVTDTDASLAYYRDTLGLKVVGGSENYGVEQERLNNVFGARLRITALRAGYGPGVELLEYLAPRTGRPISMNMDRV